MATANRKRYRRTSINMREGLDRKYDARVEMVVDDGKVVWKVFSRTMPDRCIEHRSTGDVAADEIRVESICERMDEFDRNNRIRPAPKPPRSGKRTPAQPVDRCPICGGDGVITSDEHGTQICVCRGADAD